MKLIHSATVPSQTVNHPGSTIQKKVLIDKGFIPMLTKLSLAVFEPGESTPPSKHETMYEIYFVNEGSIIFTVSSKEVTLQKGDCLVIEPNELHAAINTSPSSVHLIYFGISSDHTTA